ncbi:MAG: FHA domain-containing protein [Myxococcales bacterium]|nr:FHA domain-containing protein [Myxococcales bacterium]
MNNGPKDGNRNAPGSPYASYGPPAASGATGFEETRLLEDPIEKLAQTTPVPGPPANAHAAPSQGNRPKPKDIASEKTILHDDLKGTLGAIAKLVILEGVQQGKEFPLLEQTISFGRERDNTISFPDLSVSRYHFKVHRKNTGHDLEGLSDGNPTLLNGKTIKKPVQLKHGDRIQAGKTLLQYLVMGQNNPAPKSGAGAMIGIVVALVLLIGGIGVGLLLFANQKPVPQVDPKIQLANDSFEEGLNMFRQRKWRDAEIAFEKATSLDPKRVDAKQYITDARAESNADQKLKKVRLLLTEKNYKEAQSSLKDIEERLAPGSVYAEDLWRLQARVRKALKAQAVAVAPPVQPTPQPRRRRRRRRQATPPPTPVPTAPKVKTPEQKAMEFFVEGDLQKAKTTFSQAGNSNKASLIDQFREVYLRGKTNHNNRIYGNAIPALRQALRIDKELSDGKSVYSGQISKMLANMYSMAGLMALSKSEYGGAYSNFRRAITLRPGHVVSKAKIAEIHAKAQGWLTEAQRLKGREAKTLLLRISKTLPSTDPLCRQAKALLNKLNE